MQRVLFIALLLSLSGPLWAGRVNRCTDQGGKSQFSDLPCPKGDQAQRIRTVENVIGGSGTDMQDALEDQRRQAVRLVGSEDVVRVTGNRSKPKDLCAIARQEYVDAKSSLQCWASATCESDRTRELFKRAAQVCRGNRSDD